MYGVVGVGETHGNSLRHHRDGGEARSAKRRPPISSSPAAIILQPEIFDILENQQTGSGGEIQLTDAMIRLAGTQSFHGLKFDGRSFDCGSKVGFLAANVAYALARPDIAPAFRAEIKHLLEE